MIKTALKWIGWSVLLLILATVFFNADKTAQIVMISLGLGFWGVAFYSKEQEKHRKWLDWRLTQIERRLDRISDEMADEREARMRAAAGIRLDR